MVGRGLCPPIRIGKERARRGRKIDAPLVEEDRSVLGGREQRQIARKRAATRRSPREDDEAVRSRRRKRASHKMDASSATHHESGDGGIPLHGPKLFGRRRNPGSALQRQLMAMDQLVTINSQLDAETIELLAMELGIEIHLKQAVSLEINCGRGSQAWGATTKPTWCRGRRS